jgi:hypothetical protein
MKQGQLTLMPTEDTVVKGLPLGHTLVGVTSSPGFFPLVHLSVITVLHLEHRSHAGLTCLKSNSTCKRAPNKLRKGIWQERGRSQHHVTRGQGTELFANAVMRRKPVDGSFVCHCHSVCPDLDSFSTLSVMRDWLSSPSTFFYIFSPENSVSLTSTNELRTLNQRK